MSRRRTFYARDQRTTRLERAIQLVEDGQTGLLVKKGTQDRKHPLDRKFIPPLDRAAIKAPKRETQRGTTTVHVGYDDIAIGSNFQRSGIPPISFSPTGGTFDYFSASFGYSEGGYGEYGYGGYVSGGTEGRF